MNDIVPHYHFGTCCKSAKRYYQVLQQLNNGAPMREKILKHLERGPATMDDLKARFEVTTGFLLQLWKEGLIDQNDDNCIELSKDKP